jgi:hypothetical protein
MFSYEHLIICSGVVVGDSSCVKLVSVGGSKYILDIPGHSSMLVI